MTLARVNLPALVALWARGVDALVRADEPSHSETDQLGTDQPGTDQPGTDQPADHGLVAVRHEIAQRLRQRPASAETRDLLREFDDAFREATAESAECLLGRDAAEDAGWTRSREWYFWRTPRPRTPRTRAPRQGHNAPTPTDPPTPPQQD